MGQKCRIPTIEVAAGATGNELVNADDGHGAAALAAVEILIWQLVRAGSVDAKPLALELERYARLYDSERRTPGDAAAAESLYALVRLVRGAARSCTGDERKRPARSLWKDSHIN
jgi:hypothetical protein